MSKEGLAETVETATIPAPKTMYVEMEQDENVARGCVRVKELIAYEATKEPRRYSPDEVGGEGEIMTDRDGKTLYVENPHKPCFCQTAEQERVFAENNSGVRIETFTIQLLKSTAIKFLNDPQNMEQFKEKE